MTGVRIEDVWYPRFSTWGYSRKPDALVHGRRPVEPTSCPGSGRWAPTAAKTGNFVIVIPIE